MPQPKKVLIIDDSALVREFLKETFEADPDLMVVGTASDPYFAREKVVKFRPDVITLDIEMPRMDGLTFLGKLMDAYPTPVVMFSSHTASGAKATLDALALGAVDFVTKPKSGLASSLPSLKEELLEKVKAAAGVRVSKLKDHARLEKLPEGVMAGDEVVSTLVYRPKVSKARGDEKVVVLGASTGGTVAIENVLVTLPAESPPLAIVQHMPVHFTKAFADRLDAHCQVSVQEAQNGQRLNQGLVLIAPGGKHMLLQHDRSGYFVEVREGPLVNRHRPSVDVLFRSAVHSAGPNALAILMTGMGNDGAAGLFELKNAGAKTIAQDEVTSVVYGMPKAAVDMGAVDLILPLGKIARAILDFT